MFETARRLWRHRNLLATLAGREIKARYRGSLLGFTWSLANPLLLLGVYTLVFDVIFEARWPGTDPYAVFLLCGLFPWTWASAALLDGTTSLSANSGLIRKAVFPAEILPAVAVVAHLAHFLLALPIVGLAVLLAHILGYSVGGWGILSLVPTLVLATVALVGSAIGLAALHVHFKDIRDLLQNLLTLGFFLAPVLYPLSGVDAIHPTLGWVVRLNPAAPFIRAFQIALFEGSFPSSVVWFGMLAVAAGAWAFGTWIFRRLADTLVEAV